MLQLLLLLHMHIGRTHDGCATRYSMVIEIGILSDSTASRRNYSVPSGSGAQK